MRPIWKGYLSFGLVTIPIELYSAVKAESLGFKLLHKKDLGAITYKRVCSHCGKEVAWSDIVKGYKLPNGKYFIITPETLAKLRPKKTDNISINEFVLTSAIEPIYYETHYYALPGKMGAKAFNLLLTVLEKQDVSAVGQFVLRDKSYVTAIKSYNNCLLLSTLNYDFQIRPVDELTSTIPKTKSDPKELKLAEQLVKNLYVKKFDISEFKDTFMQDLLKEISSKKPKTKHLAEAKTKEVSLLSALQESVAKPTATAKAK